MKKYAAISTIIVSTLFFTGSSWADNTGKDVESDSLHGHGAVSASQGEAYVRAEDRSSQTGADLLSNPQDIGSGSAGSAAVPGAGAHDDHDDTLHAIATH